MIFSFICLITTNICYAFSVDSMVLVSDDSGNGIITITSTKGVPEYIVGEVSKINVVDGELEKLRLTKENLPLWDLALLPTKVILNPGERRRIAIKNLCQRHCTGLKEDKVYLIALSPKSMPNKEAKSQIGVNFGYAPYFIVPAEKPDVQYDIKFANNKLKIKNNSNTLLYFQIDNCYSGMDKKGCKITHTYLAGREKEIRLPESMIGLDKLRLRIANHDYSYNEVDYVSTK